MSEASAALDLGFEVTFRGKVCKFVDITNLEVIGNMEAYLEEQAWAALERARAKLSPVFYAEQAKGVRVDIAAGAYSYGNDGWRTAMGSRQHQKHLLWLMLRFNDPEATPALIDEMWKDRAAREELGRKLVTAFAQSEGLDPNALLGTTPGTSTP